MSKKYFKGILFLLILNLFLFIPTAFASQKYIKHSFSICFPSNWNEIPSQILDYTSTKLGLKGNKKFRYGFQKSTLERYFSLPYIVFKIDRSGRIPYGYFEGLNDFKQKSNSYTEHFLKNNELLNSLISNFSFDDIRFNKNNFSIIGNFSSENRSGELTNGILLIQLTEFGMIQIYGNSRKDNFSEFRKEFISIVNTLHLRHNSSYKPRFIDKYPQLANIEWSKFINMIIIGMIVVFLSKYFNNKKNRRKNNTVKKGL